MRRADLAFAALFGCLLSASSFCSGQESADAAPTSAGVLGPPLVAWSQLQKPLPVPQPLPAPDKDSQPDRRPSPNHRDSIVQVLVGTIARNGDRYVIVVSEVSQAAVIQDAETIKSYEGKYVRIACRFDMESGVLHVDSIE